MSGRREYPAMPMVGAGAVVRRREKVLLMKRRYPPNKGLWSLPGGLVELGESLEEAATREVLEEAGLKVRIIRLLDVQTDIHRDIHSNVRYHYVLVDFLAVPTGGRLKSNPEASEIGWFSPKGVKGLRMTAGTKRVLDLATKNRVRSTAGLKRLG